MSFINNLLGGPRKPKVPKERSLPKLADLAEEVFRKADALGFLQEIGEKKVKIFKDTKNKLTFCIETSEAEDKGPDLKMVIFQLGKGPMEKSIQDKGYCRIDYKENGITLGDIVSYAWTSGSENRKYYYNDEYGRRVGPQLATSEQNRIKDGNITYDKIENILLNYKKAFENLEKDSAASAKQLENLKKLGQI